MITTHKRKKSYILFLVFILAVTMLVGCGADDEKVATTEESITEEEVIPEGDLKVSLSIEFPKKAIDDNVDGVTMALPSDATVLDLVWAYANENNLEVQFEDDDDPYVTQIGSVSEDKQSGWAFSVNGKTSTESAGKTTLSDGDKVVWKYVKW